MYGKHPDDIATNSLILFVFDSGRLIPSPAYRRTRLQDYIRSSMAQRLYVGGLLYQVQPEEILDTFEKEGIAM